VNGILLLEPDLECLSEELKEIREMTSCLIINSTDFHLLGATSQHVASFVFSSDSVSITETFYNSVGNTNEQGSFELYKVLMGKPEGKRPLGRPRRRWEDGIRMDLREIGLKGVDWIRLSQDRDRWRAVVSAVMNLWVLAPRS
jgi:hypothetical protein